MARAEHRNDISPASLSAFIDAHGFRIMGAVAMVGCLAWIGWQIIANTAADTAAGTDPVTAVAWRPDSAAALVGLGEQALRATTSDEAAAGIAEVARRALVANPLEVRALRLLGLLADVHGDVGRAESLMQLTAARTRRDPGAQLWLFDQRTRQRDFAVALVYADALLRTRPAASADLFPTLASIAADPDGQIAMVDALATNPPWRGGFLRQVSRTEGNPAVAYSLFTALATTSYPATTAEIDPYLNAVIASGDFELAFLAWIKLLPAGQAESVPFAYNGDFEQPVTGLAFDWEFGQVRGAVTEVVDRPAGGSKALRVVFSDTRVPYRHATKLLLLQPGTYELSGTVSAEGLKTARGMRWRIACIDNGQQLAETDAFSGTLPWRPFAVTFDVPETGCRAQRLRLELDARVALQQQVVGTFWTDDLAVRRATVPVATGSIAQ